MATPNYSFNTPTEGGDDNVWGGLLNANWTSIDTILQGLEDRIVANEAAVLANRVPVGGLYLSTTDTDPATTLGYGTWAAHAAGRALIGVGNNSESTWTIGEEQGSETHTLLEAEMPSHNHNVNPPSTNTSSNGNHSHIIDTRGEVAGDGPTEVQGTNTSLFPSTTRTRSEGAHTHSINIPSFNSGSTGGGSSHNNIQPSIAVYVWRRTA